ncbi:MAG: hypothetical protein ABSB82_05170 [Terriglobia bacterium]
MRKKNSLFFNRQSKIANQLLVTVLDRVRLHYNGPAWDSRRPKKKLNVKNGRSRSETTDQALNRIIYSLRLVGVTIAASATGRQIFSASSPLKVRGN